VSTTVIYLLYRLSLTAALPFILLYFLGRSWRKPAYFSTLPERWGWLPHSFSQTGPGAVWLHAVSVGEVLSAVELLKRLRAEIPSAPLIVSVTTLAGRAIADEKLRSLVDGIFYAPLDFVFVIRRVLRRLQPRVLVVAETEIWPNLFREVKRAGCGLIIVNGRISDQAAPRYLRWRWFFRHALQWPDAILAQNAAIRDRFLALGAPADKVAVGGNLKYDFQPGVPPPIVASFLDQLRPSAVWIAASTMPPDEDDIVIDAFRELQGPGFLLILAPRKPEQFDEAARKLEQSGVSWVRRSALAVGQAVPPVSILLLDTIGELSALFSRADVVFMGGTLAPRGGHNILEPAMFGKPIIVGPHMENFRDIADAFRSAGAMIEIKSGSQLAGAVNALLQDRERAADLGRRAKACSESQRGATTAAVAEIRRLYDGAVPRFRPALPTSALLRIWHWGAAIDRRTSRARKLDAPVISVGNLTMGGSGKTPMALYLAERLSKPAILTRGYRRQSTGTLILAAGEQAAWSETGDEAQIFLRSGLAPLGIGADRAEVGRLLEERFAVEHFILDDGFQHWRLDRQVDIVLVDSLDPFPPARLRERMTALSRANIFVITRSERARPGIERELRKYNTAAPIFYSRVKPEYWVEGATGQRLDLLHPSLSKAAAFCGLANPGSFWASLSSIGLRPADRIAFPDHTRYDREAISRLLDRYGSLVTTEKDWINLGSSAPARIYWLRIRIEIDREEVFLEELEKASQKSRVFPAAKSPQR
jgi:3-deoxy-D-manno-octulosonic-acid transferase